MIISQWNPHKGEFSDVASGIKEDIYYGPQRKPNQAFTFRKITGLRMSRGFPDSEPASSEFEIFFPPLQKLLGRLTTKWGWSSEVTKHSSPYAALIYSWDEAISETLKIVESESDDERQARNDLKELLRLISTSSGDVRLDRYFKERAAFTSEDTITHDALWTLFPPGTLILGRPCSDEAQVFFVNSCHGFVSDDIAFELVCYSFDWDGWEFSRVPFRMVIDGWGGDRKRIVELPFYPLKYYQKEGLTRAQSVEKLRESLIERGKKYRSFCTAQKGSQMFNYCEGAAYFHRSTSFLQHKTSDDDVADLDYRQKGPGACSIISDDMNTSTGSAPEASWKWVCVSGWDNRLAWVLTLEQVTGAMIVDFASYMTYQPTKTPILGSLHRYEGHVADLSPERRAKKVFQDMYKFQWDGHPPEREMSPDQLLCCPPRVLGYALKQKTWVQLLVKNLRKPNKADVGTFKDKLQLDQDSKDLISKSVRAHEEGKKRENGKSKGLEDFAPEKGRGLVIMLYGKQSPFKAWSSCPFQN
jgi:hypothetical protein